MTKIYTPKEWLSFFSCPSIVIDDDGYIYSAEDYHKMIRSPIGRINYQSNYIYGKDYNALMPVPIAYMVRSQDVIKVYQYGKVYGSPILYIQNNKIYIPDEYFRVFGGNASGYIKQDTPNNSGNNTSNSNASSNASSGGGLAGILGVALIAGIIYILSDEGRLANSATILALLVNLITVVVLLVKKAQKKLYFSWDSKRFAKGLLTGIGVYVAATAVLVILGLGSNLGTGNHISDRGGDQLELAAMLMGIPFVIFSLFVNTPSSGSYKSSGKSTGYKNFGNQYQAKKPTTSYKSQPKNTYQTHYTAPTQSKTKPVSSHGSNQLFGSTVKIARCFYCKKTFTAKFPPHVRDMEQLCPKCGRNNRVRY